MFTKQLIILLLLVHSISYSAERTPSGSNVPQERTETSVFGIPIVCSPEVNAPFNFSKTVSNIKTFPNNTLDLLGLLYERAIWPEGRHREIEDMLCKNYCILSDLRKFISPQYQITIEGSFTSLKELISSSSANTQLSKKRNRDDYLQTSPRNSPFQQSEIKTYKDLVKDTSEKLHKLFSDCNEAENKSMQDEACLKLRNELKQFILSFLNISSDYFSILTAYKTVPRLSPQEK